MNRNEYIGSSDASDILAGNFSKLFRQKKGFDEREDLSDNFKVQLGIHTEDFHLDWTLKEMNATRGTDFDWSKHAGLADDPNPPQHFASFIASATSSKPVLGSHPDALIRDPSGNIFPIEVKHTGRFRSADEAADFYMPQLQHHMICWGVEQIVFSVICGTEAPDRIWIGYSEAWADHYCQQCDKFWSYMVADTAPAPALYGGHDLKVPSAIKDTIPFDGMKKRDLSKSNSAMTLIPEFITTKAQAARHEDVKKELKAMMADDENELYSPALTLKRNKAGSILFKIHDEKKVA